MDESNRNVFLYDGITGELMPETDDVRSAAQFPGTVRQRAEAPHPDAINQPILANATPVSLCKLRNYF